MLHLQSQWCMLIKNNFRQAGYLYFQLPLSLFVIFFDFTFPCHPISATGNTLNIFVPIRFLLTFCVYMQDIH